MSRTVVVEVTAEDIADGEQNDCLACPIALALRRATGVRRTSARKTQFYVRHDDGTSEACESVPSVARAFMDAFDTGRPVAPFTFTVELS